MEANAPGKATPWLEWAVACRAMTGESESGDHYLVETWQSGALVAVVDGLGHGAAAAQAARKGISILAAHTTDSIDHLFELCHKGTLTTRGMAMALATLDPIRSTLSWASVGNVDAVLFRALAPGMSREHILIRGGVVGYQLPKLRPATLPLGRGDLLVFATDGIAGDFAQGLIPVHSTRLIADRILAKHGKTTDDALVLVIRYLGPIPPGGN